MLLNDLSLAAAPHDASAFCAWLWPWLHSLLRLRRFTYSPSSPLRSRGQAAPDPGPLPPHFEASAARLAASRPSVSVAQVAAKAGLALCAEAVDNDSGWVSFQPRAGSRAVGEAEDFPMAEFPVQFVQQCRSPAACGRAIPTDQPCMPPCSPFSRLLRLASSTSFRA